MVISGDCGKGRAIEDAEDLDEPLSEDTDSTHNDENNDEDGSGNDSDSNSSSNSKLLIMNDSGKGVTTGRQIEVIENEVSWSIEAQAAKDSDSDLEIVKYGREQEERREGLRVC